MSTDSGPRPSSRRDDPLLSVLVAIGTIVGLAAFDRWWGYHVVTHIGTGWPQSRWWILQLMAVTGGYVVYAAVLLLWGRTPTRRALGAVCALLTGLYVFGLAKLFEHLVLNHGDISQTKLELYSWANLLVVPTGIALAWGIARRHGTLWMLGLVVAPSLATATHELQRHSGWWQEHVTFRTPSHWELAEAVFLTPAVLAAVACWLIDAAATRRTSSGPAAEPSPEMQSSA